jgi:hypothetical protein
VEKGCGKRATFQTDFQSRGNFNAHRQCFVSSIRNTTTVTNNYFGNGSLELIFNDTETRVASSQVTRHVAARVHMQAASVHIALW